MNFGSTCEFCFGWERTRELAEHLVIGTAKRLHASVVSAFKDTLQVIDGSLAIRSDGTDGVVCLIRQHGDGGALQAVVLEHLADAFEVRRIADVEDRNFNTIVAGGLEFFDDWVVRLGDVAGVEQKVESDFHGVGREAREWRANWQGLCRKICRACRNEAG